MTKYEAIQNSEIKHGDKITIVSQSDFGFMYTIQTVYDHSQPKAHYQNCPESMYGVNIFHTPKGKRRLHVSSIDYITPLVIYKGWQNIDVNSIIYTERELTDEQIKAGIVSHRESKYTSFDDLNFSDLRAAYPDCILSA